MGTTHSFCNCQKWDGEHARRALIFFQSHLQSVCQSVGCPSRMLLCACQASHRSEAHAVSPSPPLNKKERERLRGCSKPLSSQAAHCSPHTIHPICFPASETSLSSIPCLRERAGGWSFSTTWKSRDLSCSFTLAVLLLALFRIPPSDTVFRVHSFRDCSYSWSQ